MPTHTRFFFEKYIYVLYKKRWWSVTFPCLLVLHTCSCFCLLFSYCLVRELEIFCCQSICSSGSSEDIRSCVYECSLFLLQTCWCNYLINLILMIIWMISHVIILHFASWIVLIMCARRTVRKILINCVLLVHSNQFLSWSEVDLS
jgi:hypothetical protein